MVGIIALLFLIFGLPFMYYLIGTASEKIEERGGGGYCALIMIALGALITILAVISSIKSCAENDRGPSYDYYDAPRK